MMSKARWLTPTRIVLGLLCVMYFITYVDRVNVATAAGEIKRELALSNTELGFVFSAFAYPYLLFQVFGESLRRCNTVEGIEVFLVAGSRGVYGIVLPVVIFE